MASITLTDSSLVRFVQRQGSLANLVQVRLTSGELGYTTDSKRLFIGDGTKLGGAPVGSKFVGLFVSHDTARTAGYMLPNDLYYNTIERAVYMFEGGTTFTKVAEISKATLEDIDARITTYDNALWPKLYQAFYTKGQTDTAIDNKISVAIIPSTRVSNLENDTRLVAKFFDKVTVNDQTINSRILFKSDLVAEKNITFATFATSAMTQGRANFNTDGINVGIENTLFLRNAPVRNWTTIGDKANRNQFNAEGYRYIRSILPNNNDGSNGDLYFLV